MYVIQVFGNEIGYSRNIVDPVRLEEQILKCVSL